MNRGQAAGAGLQRHHRQLPLLVIARGRSRGRIQERANQDHRSGRAFLRRNRAARHGGAPGSPRRPREARDRPGFGLPHPPRRARGRYINFYVANGNGEPVAKTAQFHGELENIDVGRLGMAHLTIDKSEIMQRKVISAIDAVTFGGSRAPSGAQRARPEAHAAKPGRRAASSAIERY